MKGWLDDGARTVAQGNLMDNVNKSGLKDHEWKLLIRDEGKLILDLYIQLMQLETAYEELKEEVEELKKN